MLKVLLPTLILLSFRLLASETFLPEKLLCWSEAKRMDLQQFTLSKINSGKPFLTSDLKWENTTFTGPELAFTFQGQDQVALTLKFSKMDLYQLKLGSVPTISGELTQQGLEESDLITCSEVK